MRPDDQRAFDKGDGDAVVLTVGLWAAGDGVHLRIDTAGGSARGQRVLLGDLKRLLIADGCWVPGDEGVEGQAGGTA